MNNKTDEFRVVIGENTMIIEGVRYDILPDFQGRAYIERSEDQGGLPYSKGDIVKVFGKAYVIDTFREDHVFVPCEEFEDDN